MENKLKKVKLSSLQYDEELLELRPLNIYYISQYRQAYREDADFPPIVIDKKTNMIVNGNHRFAALSEEYPIDHEIRIIVKSFRNRKAIINEFANDNAKCGQPLTTFSKKKITNALIREGASVAEIAQIFSVSVTKLKTWGEGKNVVVVIGRDINNKTVRKTEIVKNAFEPQKKAITQKEYDVHKKVDKGIPIMQQVGQLTRWVENRSFDPTPENVALLRELYGSIGEFLKEMRLKNVG